MHRFPQNVAMLLLRDVSENFVLTALLNSLNVRLLDTISTQIVGEILDKAEMNMVSRGWLWKMALITSSSTAFFIVKRFNRGKQFDAKADNAS